MLPGHRPLAYLLLGFCFGIIVGRHAAAGSIIPAVLALLFCALLFWRTARGCTSLLIPAAIFLLLGMLAAAQIPDPDEPPPGIQRLLKRKQALVLGSITHPPEPGLNTTLVHLQLEAFENNGSWHPVSGNLLLSIKECEQQWSAGQRLIGRLRLKPIRNFNNPGGFDYRQHLANQRIWAKGYVRRDADLVALGNPDCSRLAQVLDHIHVQSSAFLDDSLPSDHAGLYRALLLGQRFALRPELKEILYNAGVGHLLAISGLHLGMVGGLAFLVFHFILARTPPVAGRWGARPVAALAAFPVAIGYAMLTGMGLPALRATIMLAVFTLALVVYRERDLVNSLLLAAAAILTLQPESLFSASFQLSFIAVAALVCVVPRLPVPAALKNGQGARHHWRRWSLRLYQFTCATGVISLYTAPVVLVHFHRLTPVGLITNLLAVPLVCFLVLPAGLLALCFLPFSAGLAAFFLTLGSLGLTVVIKLATIFGSLSWGTFWPGTPTVWQAAVAYLLLLAPLAAIPKWWRVILVASGALLLTASWLIPPNFFSEPAFLRVTYLDVSQGNAAAVEFPGKSAMLIDGGGFQGGAFDVGRYVVAPYLWERRIRRLKALVLSHAHPDHFLGLQFVAAHFPIGEFWYNNVLTDQAKLVHLMNCLARKNIAPLGPKELQAGRNIEGVNVRVLHPAPHCTLSGRHLTDKELNDLSLVLRLNYGGVSFLFPGDIEREAEYRLAAQSDLGPVDVLLVPHHGSRTSSSLAFLQKLRPRIAVFSVGFDNRFHLPATGILERYRALGVQMYRTDLHGAVTIRTDGRKIEVETVLGAAEAD